MNPINPMYPSQMKHSFANVPKIGLNRSSFKSPSTYKTTFNAGKLIPFLVKEVIPGDTWKYNNTLFARLNTPEVPFMDQLYLDTQYFFVPCRLIWEHWQNFMGERIDPNDPEETTDYVVPVVESPVGGWTAESLACYFGIPIGVEKDVNALPFRAYNLVYNEFYRDQNIISPAPFSKGDGPDSAADYEVLRRGKRHDYFTSCLLSPQKGDPVSISMTGNAPVVYDPATGAVNPNIIRRADTGAKAGVQSNLVSYDATDSYFSDASSGIDLFLDPNGSLVADLSSISSLTINAWREALQLQALAEVDARGGTRYIEILYSHFQVVSPDMRLQRPEYLGGSTTPVYVVPVAQTSDTGAGTPQGNLAAYGQALAYRDGFTKSFVEHGYILGIASVRADLTYSQNLNRMWSRSTKYDFFWPMLQNIGEQAVLTQEIFCDGSATDDVVFGYQERYAEYMYSESLITGKLRPAYATSLDYWHLSQEFADAPTLSQEFIEENPPIDRVVAVVDEPHFLLDVYLDAVAVRPMALYSIPGYLGRF